AVDRTQPTWLDEVTTCVGVGRPVTGERAVQPERLPLVLGRMRSSTTGDAREVKPAADARRAVALAAGIAKQVALGARPHGVGDVLRERLGDEPTQMRRAFDVRRTCILQRRAR